jgi:hypothetical protein
MRIVFRLLWIFGGMGWRNGRSVVISQYSTATAVKTAPNSSATAYIVTYNFLINQDHRRHKFSRKAE